MTTETTTTDTTEVIPEPEVKNPAAILAKNRELLRELAEVKAALQAEQDAHKAAQGAETAWRDRVYQSEVMAPLEADLRDLSGGPWKYTKDTCTELGLLKMEPDADGFERPTWYDEKGEPADLTLGLYRFLCEVYRRTDNDLGRCLRGSGASGGGAGSSGSSRAYTHAPKPATPAAPPPAFGLR